MANVQAQFYPDNFYLLSSMYGFMDPAVENYDPPPLFNNINNINYQQQQQQQQQNENENLSDLSSMMNVQRQEIDYILQLQHERLRCLLQEKSNQQLATLIHNLEIKASFLMRQKETNLARANQNSLELQACLNKAEFDNQSWKKLALQNEATVINLSNTLEQLKQRLLLLNNNNNNNNIAEDAESLLSGGSATSSSSSSQKRSRDCKRCGIRKSCVVLLPCRHLTSCKDCEPILVSCPVCKSVKKASMDVFWT
ncbi:hypothetical protein ACFE04_013845 [Oxalis oulophora]